MIDVPYDEQILGKQKILDELIGDYVKSLHRTVRESRSAASTARGPMKSYL